MYDCDVVTFQIIVTLQITTNLCFFFLHDVSHPRHTEGAYRRRHPDTADGVTSSSPHPVGPAETACRAYALKALVVGAFGEASPDLLELMEQVANATATDHHRRAYGYKSALAGRAPALATITRGLGMLVARLNAQLVLRRLVYVGDGPQTRKPCRGTLPAGHVVGR